MARIETFTGTSLSAGPAAKEVLCKDHATVNPAHPVHVDVGPCPVVAGWGRRDWQRSAAGPSLQRAERLWWVAARGWALALAGGLGHGPGGGCGWPGLLDQCLGRLGLMDLTSAWGLLALGLLGYRRTTPSSLGWPRWNGRGCSPWPCLERRPLCPPAGFGTRSSAATTSCPTTRAPADWWTLGHMGPLTTNAYSGLPGGAEAPSFIARPLGRNPRCDGLGSAKCCAILVIHTPACCTTKCRSCFGLPDDPVDHGDGFHGLHRSVRHARMRDDFASPWI